MLYNITKIKKEEDIMFVKIRLKNYKSLVDFSVDFLQKKGVAKKAIFVYGENGVGKSNFASAFYTLYESIQTLSVRRVIQTILEKKYEDKEINEEFIKYFSRNLRDTESIINNCKTINSDENMELEFDFILNGKMGTYLLVYDNEKLIREKLSYVLNKNKCVLFDLSENEKIINKKLFLDPEYADKIRNMVLQYEGKHSLLSIIINEKEEKTEGYIESKIHKALDEVILFFMTMSIKVKNGDKGERGALRLFHPIVAELTDGTINIDEQVELDNAEVLLNEFFTKTYSDIKEVYYKRKQENNKIKYELFFRKMVYNEILEVSYEAESTGTLHLINILPFLLMSIENTVVVIDEIDTGIHDLLVDNILNNIIDSINGQLIVTTHNTMLLDSDINPEYIYSFIVDEYANKELVSIADFEDRTHPNLNYRSRYLKGMYGGIPHLGDIDFEELNDIFKLEGK